MIKYNLQNGQNKKINKWFSFGKTVLIKTISNEKLFMTHGYKNGKLQDRKKILQAMLKDKNIRIICCFPFAVEKTMPYNLKNRIINIIGNGVDGSLYGACLENVLYIFSDQDKNST